MDQMLIERLIETVDELKKTLEKLKGSEVPEKPYPPTCPVCHSEAEIVTEDGIDGETFIRCTVCGLETRWWPSRKEAIEAWTRKM